MLQKLQLANFQSPRFGHESLIFENKVLIFGGSNKDGFISHLELLDLNTNEIKIINLKLAQNDKENCLKASFKMNYLKDLNRVFIFGGIDRNREFNNYVMLLENLSSLKYVQVAGEAPIPRIGHSFTKINDNTLVVFGGVGPSLVNPQFLNDLYILHIQDGILENNLVARWEKITTDPLQLIPPPRESHSAVLHHDRIIIFGGMDGKQRLNDTWVLNINDWTFDKPEITGCKPLGRSLHTANLSDDCMYVFGGFTTSNIRGLAWSCTNSLQRLNLVDMTWTSMSIGDGIKKIEARASHSSFQNHGRIYLWGGRRDSYFLTHKSSIETIPNCWYLDTQVPTQVENLQLIFVTNNSILIKFSKANNAACYVIEMRKPAKFEKADDVVKMEVDEPPTTILVRKVENPIVAVKKPKIIIKQHHKITTLLNKINIAQFDGVDDKFGSDTESEQETGDSCAFEKWSFVKMVFNVDPTVIRNYYDWHVSRNNLTSEDLPKITNQKQIMLKPKEIYQIRVSAVNSCGISTPSNILTVQTALVQPLSCLQLQVQNSKFMNFSWKSTVVGMEFVVLLVTIFDNYFNYATIYKGKKSYCLITKETFEQKNVMEYVLQVSIMAEGNIKICEHELRWKAKK